MYIKCSFVSGKTSRKTLEPRLVNKADTDESPSMTIKASPYTKTASIPIQIIAEPKAILLLQQF